MFLFLMAWSLAASTFVLFSKVLLIGSILLSFCSWMGWIRRFLWLSLEHALSQALNGTPITIGSLEVDLLGGKLFLSNLIIHTPLRREWRWESPLIARIGKLHLDFDFLSIMQRLLRKQQLVLDIYSLEISDVQAFVERHEHVFNFYLLDPLMVLPDPKDVLQHCALSKEPQPTINRGDNDFDEVFTEADVDEEDEQHEQNAKNLVNKMVEAVQNLGKDAKKGGWKGALVRQRHSLKSKLKELQSTKKTDAMNEGVQVLKKVGKVVAHKTKALNLPTPKRRARENGQGIKPLFVRVGRVLLHEGRIFTRTDENTWNKPIAIHQVWIRSTELCPSMSLNDENDKPALYQPIDKVIEVVLKRVLAEIAKSQTGRLFNTALGEVLGLIKSSTEGAGGVESL